MKHKVVLITVLALMLVLATGVSAGGWAVIVLDEPLGEIHLGETYSVGFTVMQHGQSPIHQLDDGAPIEPLLTATNSTTGEKIEATGVPTKETGHFVVEMTFPSEGNWEWNIEPAPLLGDTVFEPLTVLPPLPAASSSVSSLAIEPADGSSIVVALRWTALAVTVVAIVLASRYIRQRRAKAVAVES